LDLVVKHSNYNEGTIIWALVCSIVFHGLLVAVIPNLKFDSSKNSDLLEIQLIDKKPKLPPIVLPEPIVPLSKSTKTKVDQRIAPIAKSLPNSTEIKNEIPLIQSQPSITKLQSEVIAVTPKLETAAPIPIVTPEITPDPPKPSGPSQADIDEARGQYGKTLWSAIEKHKNYPRIAQLRGWQGDVIVELILDGNGKLKSKKIIQSSGYESLDKQALEMAEQASPFPLPPDTLRSSSFSIKVPIPFKLEPQ